MTGRPTAAQYMIDERSHKVDLIHKMASALASEDPEKTFEIADLDRQVYTRWKVHPRTKAAYYETLSGTGAVEFNFTKGVVLQFANGITWKPKDANRRSPQKKLLEAFEDQ